jgi:hypothetical protein
VRFDLQILPVEAFCKVLDIRLNEDQVKQMKRRVFQFIAVVCFSSLAVLFTVKSPAQDLGSLGKQAQNLGGLGNISALTQKLHLSPEQLQKVMPILQGEVPKLQAIKDNPNLSTDQKQTQGKAVQQQSDSKLKNILSSQQFGTLQGFRAQQLQALAQGAIPH